MEKKAMSYLLSSKLKQQKRCFSPRNPSPFPEIKFTVFQRCREIIRTAFTPFMQLIFWKSEHSEFLTPFFQFTPISKTRKEVKGQAVAMLQYKQDIKANFRQSV